MVEVNKIFRGSDQFNAAAQKFLMDNASKFVHTGEKEHRLYLPNLIDLAADKPNCINANVQRYKSCLVIIISGKSSVNLTIYDQFDNKLYRELGSFSSWIRELYKNIIFP